MEAAAMRAPQRRLGGAARSRRARSPRLPDLRETIPAQRSHSLWPGSRQRAYFTATLASLRGPHWRNRTLAGGRDCHGDFRRASANRSRLRNAAIAEVKNAKPTPLEARAVRVLDLVEYQPGAVVSREILHKI